MGKANAKGFENLISLAEAAGLNYSKSKNSLKPPTASTAVFLVKVSRAQADLAQPECKAIFGWIARDISQPVKARCHFVNEGLAKCIA